MKGNFQMKKKFVGEVAKLNLQCLRCGKFPSIGFREGIPICHRCWNGDLGLEIKGEKINEN